MALKVRTGGSESPGIIINEELSCTGIKLCINSEYAPEYLKKATEQYAEAWQIDETMFVHGRGHRKTTQQRHYEKLREYAVKLEEYVEKIKICGKERNSYSKTDNDATSSLQCAGWCCG